MPTDRPPYTALDPDLLAAPEAGLSLAAPGRTWLRWTAVLLPVLFAAIAYAALQPPSVDLAAQMFRSELFASDGFLTWNNYWYGGHHLLGYSLLFPPLGAAVGPTAVGGLAAVVATAIFGAVAQRRYGAQARLGTLWFGAGMIAMLLSGRLTFALGVAVGLGALLAMQRGRPAIAVPLAAATSFASPVAGFFLLLVGGALTLTGGRRQGGLLAASAAAPIALMTIAFPGGGPEPFVVSSAAPTLAVTALVFFMLPRRERLLRRGTALYGAAALAAFAVPSPLGGNVARLSNLAAGPLLALALAGPRRRLLLALCALPLVYWQWQAAVRDVSRAAADPSVKRGFYAPLLDELERRTAGTPVRIEIPPTHDRWEAYYVSPGFMLARGWMRQLETDESKLFRFRLSAANYHAWLRRQGVSYVALPNARLDYMAEREARLIASGLPYLKPLWRNEDWRLYAVRDSAGLVDPPASLIAIGADWLVLRTPRPGRFLLRVHFNPYWKVGGAPACLSRQGKWTLVRASSPGVLRISTDLSLRGAWKAVRGARRIC